LAQRVDRFVINLQLPEDREGVGAERTEVIPYGIRVPTEREGRRERGDWLDELAVPRTARLIGVVSPLVAAARIEDAIWAADLLKIVRDDTFLLIVGHGPWRFRLERFCRQVGITDRVRFLNARPDPPSPVGLLDCLWVTGRSAGIHWGLAEAMAWGIPVVAVDCPAHRALVMPGITGMLVACGDRTALARATLHLLEDAAQARQLGEAARRRAREAHRVLPIVARYESLYRSLVG
jgi:glycosyltransferase involved in cell wall biosynthesis